MNEKLEKNNFCKIEEEKIVDNIGGNNNKGEYYTKYNKLKSEYNMLKEKYELKNNEVASITNDLKRNKEELFESKKNYKLLNDEKVKLKADILELKADFKMDKNQYEKKITNLEKQLSAKNNLLVEIKNNNETNNNNDLIIINLRKKISEIQNENILLKEEIKQQNDELDELNEKIGEQNRKINQKISELSYNQRINEELKKKLKEKEFPSNFDKNKNYDCIKCYQLTDKLKWFLLKKEEKEKNRYNYYKNNKNLYINCDYSSFIWLSEENLKTFGIEDKKYNYDIEIEQSPKILEGKLNTKYNFNFNKKDNNFNNEKLIETIEKLKNENKYLNKIILKYKTELNMMDISNIKDEIDDSLLTDDKCFEDLLDDLDIPNNNNVNNIYNIHNNNNNMKIYLSASKNTHTNKNNRSLYMLKESIDSLMSQIKPSQNARDTLGLILKQLGCTDDEVKKLMDHKL